MKLFFACKSKSQSYSNKRQLNKKEDQNHQQIPTQKKSPSPEDESKNKPVKDQIFQQILPQKNRPQSSHPTHDQKSKQILQKDCLQFLDSIPEQTLALYSPRMRNILKDEIQKDKPFRERFKIILGNFKLDFHEKVQNISLLYAEKQREETEQKQRDLLNQSLDEMNGFLNTLNDQQAQLDAEFSIFESQKMSKTKIKNPQKYLLRKSTKELKLWEKQLQGLENSSFDMKQMLKKIWDIKESFEDELRSQEKGWEKERKALISKEKIRQQNLKNLHIFKIEALESALIESKFKYNKEIDQKQMIIADLESQIFRIENQQKCKQMDDFIEQEKKHLSTYGLSFYGFGDRGVVNKLSGLALRNQKQILKSVNGYFEIIKNFEQMKQNYIKWLSTEEQRTLVLYEQLNVAHQSSVLYHDAIYLLIYNFCFLSKKCKIITTEQMDNFINSIIPNENKLTMSLQKLNDFINLIQQFSFENKIEKFVQKNNEAEVLIQKVKSILQILSKEILQVKNKEIGQESIQEKEKLVGMGVAEVVEDPYQQILQQTQSLQTFFTQIQTLFDFQDNIETQEPIPEQIVTINDQIDIPKKQQKGRSTIKSKSKEKKKKEETVKQTNLEIIVTNKKSGLNYFQQLNKKIPRLTISSYQIELIIKSVARKKILYQYDQLQNEQITKERINKFYKNLKENPLTNYFLIKNIEIPSDSESEDDQKQKTKKTKIQQKKLQQQNQFKNQLKTFDENKINFDELIQIINKQLQIEYRKIQKFQFKNKLEGLHPDGQSINYGAQKIMSIDCVFVESFGPPQINLIPLKTLMLQGKGDQAFQLIRNCLKLFTNFMEFQSLKEDDDSVGVQQIDLRGLIEQEVAVQCGDPEDVEIVKFEIIKDQLSNITNDMIQENLFDDGQYFFINSFQNCLETCKTEEDFIFELNMAVQNKINKMKTKIEEIQKKLDNQSLRQPIQLKIKKLDDDEGQQVSFKQISSDSEENLQPRSILKSTKFSQEQSSDKRQFKKQVLSKYQGKELRKTNTLTEIERLKQLQKTFQDQSTQTINQKKNFYQQPQIKLKRYDDLLKESKSTETSEPKKFSIPAEKKIAQQQTEIKGQLTKGNETMKRQIIELQVQVQVLKQKLKTQLQSDNKIQLRSSHDQLISQQISNDKTTKVINSSLENQKRNQVVICNYSDQLKDSQMLGDLKSSQSFTSISLLQNQKIQEFVLVGGFGTQIKHLFESLPEANTQSINNKSFESANIYESTNNSKALQTAHNFEGKSFSINQIQQRRPQTSNLLEKTSSFKISQIKMFHLNEFEPKKQSRNQEISQYYTDNQLNLKEVIRPRTSLSRNFSANLITQQPQKNNQSLQIGRQSLSAIKRQSNDSEKYFLTTKDFKSSQKQVSIKDSFDGSVAKVVNLLGLGQKRHINQSLLKYQKSFQNFKI